MQKFQQDNNRLPQSSLFMLELAKNNVFRFVKEGNLINPNYATMQAIAELYQCNKFLHITAANTSH